MPNVAARLRAVPSDLEPQGLKALRGLLADPSFRTTLERAREAANTRRTAAELVALVRVIEEHLAEGEDEGEGRK